jgi:hypothetical protein
MGIASRLSRSIIWPGSETPERHAEQSLPCEDGTPRFLHRSWEMRQAKLVVLGVVTVVLLPWIAAAQNPQPAPPGQAHTDLAPPNAPSPPPEQIRPATPRDSASGGQTLSDKLSQQQGTLQPPTIDPGIRKPLPQQGRATMPVIPPPGTAGGNQQVIPK